MRYHVVLTAHAHYPRAAPEAVMRIDGDQEEIFDPARGWTAADSRYREWFVNTRISETEAETMTARIGPLPSLDDEEWDPRNVSRRALAIEGYGDQDLHFAVEAGGHPFDDPLTAVDEQLSGERLRLSFTRDLSWKVVPVEGRLVRITAEDSKRFEQVQARRVFGDVEIRHFAVVNHLRPDLRDPYLLLREHADVVDDYGLHLYELYDENRQWVRVGHQSRLGKPVQGELLDHLLTSWTPLPVGEHEAYFAFLDDDGSPLRVVHVQAEKFGYTTERTFVTYWHEPSREDGCALRGAGERVEIDAERAAELVQVLENLDRGPADGRFRYWECKKPYSRGLRYGVDLRYARTWGGTDGLLHTEWYSETQDLWYLGQFPGEVRGMEHRPVEVSETPVLRRSSLDRRSTR